MAMSTTFGAIIMLSKRLRSEIATQSLVWNAFCVSRTGVLADELVARRTWDTGRAAARQATEGGHVPPRGGSAEPRHLELGQHRGV